MRHEHKELIRDEMRASGKYCHDVCSLSISDIYCLIAYNKSCPERSYILSEYKRSQRIAELEEYLQEFNARLGNRTADFKL